MTAFPCVSTSSPLTYVWAFGFVGCILFFLRRYHCQHLGREIKKNLCRWQAPTPPPNVSNLSENNRWAFWRRKPRAWPCPIKPPCQAPLGADGNQRNSPECPAANESTGEFLGIRRNIREDPTQRSHLFLGYYGLLASHGYSWYVPDLSFISQGILLKLRPSPRETSQKSSRSRRRSLANPSSTRIP